MAKKTIKDYIFAVGRRKSSIARLRLFKGKGQTVVNGLPIEAYFADVDRASVWAKPLQLAKVSDKYWATIKVIGGGKKGQLDSVIHAFSRAIASINEETYKPVLRKHGLLTRDSRTRERRKVGTGGKARRRKQSPKR